MVEQVHGLQYDPYGLGSILRNFVLRVPPNQRDYSWTKDEVNDLLSDFARCIGGIANDQYFLGTIVTIPQSSDMLEVVDGQQRLATTTILLCAIRDYLKKRPGDALLVEDLEKFLRGIDRDANERVPRLRMNVSDAHYFQERIYDSDENSEQKTVSHELINEAAEISRTHVLNIVRAYDVKDHGKVLNQWIAFIERRALVLLLRVQSGANAYRMFETLNDRGLRTSQSDLVKNLLFGKSGDRLPEAQDKWASMRAILEQTDDDEILITYLRHMLMVLGGFLRVEEVYEKVQERSNGATPALQLLADFERGARDYIAILFADHEKWNPYPPAARKAITALNLLRTKAFRPIMLAIARSFDEQQAAKGFRLLVDAWVRYMIVGGSRSGSTETRIANIAMEITSGQIANARDLHAALSSIVPADAIFVEQFRLASVSDRIFARYYLRSLERTAKAEPEPCFIPNDDQTEINLEHVLPRHAEGNYPLFDAEQAKAYVNRIGNLALLQVRPNSDARNSPFESKREAYRQTSFVLTQQVAGWVGDWSPKGIVDRQNVLAGLALKTWPFTVPAGDGRSGPQNTKPRGRGKA